ncbi:MAG: hypothetical protein LBQ12_16220, partial [Deltaproteobacteria bacterium]|nr:hypothetical protein [Deltaproteobacteria bacterium]
MPTAFLAIAASALATFSAAASQPDRAALFAPVQIAPVKMSLVQTEDEAANPADGYGIAANGSLQSRYSFDIGPAPGSGEGLSGSGGIASSSVRAESVLNPASEGTIGEASLPAAGASLPAAGASLPAAGASLPAAGASLPAPG